MGCVGDRCIGFCLLLLSSPDLVLGMIAFLLRAVFVVFDIQTKLRTWCVAYYYCYGLSIPSSRGVKRSAPTGCMYVRTLYGGTST